MDSLTWIIIMLGLHHKGWLYIAIELVICQGWGIGFYPLLIKSRDLDIILQLAKIFCSALCHCLLSGLNIIWNYQAVALFKSYFGGAFDEDAIRNNFVLIYELLDGNAASCFLFHSML